MRYMVVIEKGSSSYSPCVVEEASYGDPARLPVMRGLCAARGFTLPELVTPFELMGVSP